MSKTTRAIVVPERISTRIFFVRGQKVMLSTHLAELYEVEPRVLVQAVKRNTERFPEDFMFQLSAEEYDNLKSQIVISSWGGFRRAAPYAFTEQGVAMLSSALRSPRTVQGRVRRHPRTDGAPRTQAEAHRFPRGAAMTMRRPREEN